MRLIPQTQAPAPRPKAPRISISQAEITADLLYPASPRAAARGAAAGARGARR